MNDYQNDNDIKTESLMDKISMRLLRWWGMLFRALFITLVGIIGYLWMDPQPMGDVPLGQLTLKQIAGNIMGVVIPIACFIWLFKLNKKYGDESLPYEDWGRFGGYALLFVFAAFAWITKNKEPEGDRHTGRKIKGVCFAISEQLNRLPHSLNAKDSPPVADAAPAAIRALRNAPRPRGLSCPFGRAHRTL